MKKIIKDRNSVLKQANKPDSIYSTDIVGFIVVIAFVAIDMVCMYSVWNVVTTQNPIMIVFIAAGCAICLDVPLAIAAQVLKMHHQGLASRRTAAIVFGSSVAAFAVPFIASAAFRIVSREISFGTKANSNLVNTAAEAAENATNAASEEEAAVVLVAAIINAVLPLATSIASFVVSYFAADPLGKRIMRKRKALIKNQADMIEKTRMLEEAETKEEFLNIRMAYEKDRYLAHMELTDMYNRYLNQLGAAAVRNKLGTPDDVTAQTEYGNAVNQRTAVSRSFDTELARVAEDLMNSSAKGEETINTATV